MHNSPYPEVLYFKNKNQLPNEGLNPVALSFVALPTVRYPIV